MKTIYIVVESPVKPCYVLTAENGKTEAGEEVFLPRLRNKINELLKTIKIPNVQNIVIAGPENQYRNEIQERVQTQIDEMNLTIPVIFGQM